MHKVYDVTTPLLPLWLRNMAASTMWRYSLIDEKPYTPNAASTELTRRAQGYEQEFQHPTRSFDGLVQAVHTVG